MPAGAGRGGDRRGQVRASRSTRSILSLIVIFSVLALLLMGDQISAILSTIAGQL